jgi:putative acetyltransferase
MPWSEPVKRSFVMKIIEGGLSSEQVVALLNEHMEDMITHSPPESVHALDLESLGAADVSFWTVWDGGELLGCGAVKALDQQHGEIKSMRTVSTHLGRGVASALLQHIIEESRARGWSRLSLETGSGSAFEPAYLLYEKFGFEFCGPFGTYREDSFSRFMTLKLNG